MYLCVSDQLKCPAFVNIQFYFFCFVQIAHDSKRARKEAAKCVEEAILNGTIEIERKIIVALPEPSDHENHFVGEVSEILLYSIHV